MRDFERNIIAIAIVAFLGGCDREVRRSVPASHTIVADVLVSVTNTNSDERSILLSDTGSGRLLGVVPGRSSRSFSVPSGIGDSTRILHLEAESRTDATRTLSRPFRLASGQRVIWTVGKDGAGRLAIH